MYLRINRHFNLLDGAAPKKHNVVIIPPGWYELELIQNPHGWPAPWLVIKGTLFGATEKSLRWQATMPAIISLHETLPANMPLNTAGGICPASPNATFNVFVPALF